ncbi:hypothetical protein HNP81_000041 [Peribacillus huizhouensis]|uniref:Uncharacterized protein n=1 Tax=Peribacillus huizhouensis TaxID=1501239 RepID=A0ABR6CIP5_9BACI|nr:hypothetical protein [Peribacillus huizhouensis]
MPNAQELVKMAGSIVVLEIEVSKTDKFNSEFKKIQRDSKKTVLQFNVKGDNQAISSCR